jgi:molybdate transport system substrate-binding protein
MAEPFTRRQLICMLATAAAGSLSCRREQAVQLFAAASLEPAITELAGDFEAETQVRVSANFAGSNTLARQIVSSRTADVFFSADDKWMDFVAERGLIRLPTRRAVLTNCLVVIAQSDSHLALGSPSELASAQYSQLVVADTLAVPAGRYARAWLTRTRHANASLWSSVEPRILPVLDVRAVSATVRADPRRLGITYASELVKTQELKVVFEVPEAEHPKIVYPIALLAEAPHPDGGRLLLEHLCSDRAKRVYRRHGFEPLPA